jgi:hypothetical protein
MAVVELERDVTQYRPRALHMHPAWIGSYPDAVQKLAKAAIEALSQIGGEASKAAVVDALRALEFTTPGQRGEDAVRRGRAAKEKPKTVVMGRGPVVAIPTIVKTMLRERVNAYGQGECHAALLEAILGYLGNTGECMDLFATNENPAAHGNAQTGHNQTTKGILS